MYHFAIIHAGLQYLVVDSLNSTQHIVNEPVRQHGEIWRLLSRYRGLAFDFSFALLFFALAKK